MPTRVTPVSSPLGTRSLALAAVVAVVGAGAGCRDCGGPLASAAKGEILPPVFEFGPITKGQICTANLKVKNTGTEDLSVTTSTLENTSGNFNLTKAPALVRLGGSEDLLVGYKAGDTVGKTESTGIKLVTDEKENGGVLRASITAIVADGPVATAKSQCGNPAASPCTTLDFGSTQINGAGVTLGVVVVNDGTQDLHIQPNGAQLANTSGTGVFLVDSVLLGTTVVQDFATNGVTIPPTRSSDCGKPTGSNVTATIQVRFVPTALGGATDTLTVITDAVNSDGKDGGTMSVPLIGNGSDVGILITPTSLNFGAVTDGQTKTVQVLVSNEGTSNASVNESCISLHNDGNCDADCDGQGTTTPDGTLSCKVTKSDGTTLESLGFVLAPTDAKTGGDDERDIFVTWAPTAGHDSIPTTAVLALKSNILANKIFTAQLIGGAVGVIDFSSTDGDCGGAVEGVCVHTTGTACTCPPSGSANDCNLPADTSTWQGQATVTLTNSGQATVTIASVDLDCGATIADDYSVGQPSSSTIAPAASATVAVSYHNNDASCVDPCNLVVHHDGAGGQTTVPLDIIPPQ